MGSGEQGEAGSRQLRQRVMGALCLWPGPRPTFPALRSWFFLLLSGPPLSFLHNLTCPLTCNLKLF